MLKGSNLLQRPLALLSAVCFAGAAVVASNLVSAWSVPPLQRLYFDWLAFFFTLGSFSGLLNLFFVLKTARTSEEVSTADGDTEKKLKFLREAEFVVAGLAILAFAYVPIRQTNTALADYADQKRVEEFLRIALETDKRASDQAESARSICAYYPKFKATERVSSAITEALKMMQIDCNNLAQEPVSSSPTQSGGAAPEPPGSQSFREGK